MLADVAEPRCAEERVGDGVQDNVGVAVPGEAASMRHFDAAKHDRSLAGEAVNVEARTGARAKQSGEPLRRSLEICGKSELFESGVALHSSDAHARSANNGCLVSWWRPAPIFVGRPKGVEPESLRCLYANHAATIDWLVQRFADPRERVADWQHWRGAFEEFQACKQAVYHGGWTEGASGVVNEDGITFEDSKAHADRICTLRAPFEKIADLQAIERCCGAILLSLPHHYAHGSHGSMTDQRLHCPAQHRLAA